MKKILIISGSPRKNGNSDILCDQFLNGASESGNQVEKIWLGDKKMGFCTACYACQKGNCPQQDDAIWIASKMLSADVIVLATPVYFYTMSAQLKTLIDRSVMFYPRIEKKEFYYIMTMADTDPANFKGTIEALRGFVECCENSIEKGFIGAFGVYEKGEIRHTSFMQQAFDLGSSC